MSDIWARLSARRSRRRAIDELLDTIDDDVSPAEALCDYLDAKGFV